MKHYEDRDIYQLGCAAGVLETLYARSAFTKLNGIFEFEIPETKIGLRAAVSKLSVGGGQGMVKCNCLGYCDSNRCNCKKSQLLCNSRCHHNNSKCKNK